MIVTVEVTAALGCMDPKIVSWAQPMTVPQYSIIGAMTVGMEPRVPMDVLAPEAAFEMALSAAEREASALGSAASEATALGLAAAAVPLTAARREDAALSAGVSFPEAIEAAAEEMEAEAADALASATRRRAERELAAGDVVLPLFAAKSDETALARGWAF